MAKASTKNYDSAVQKYDELVNKYYGADNYKNLYKDASKVASENSKQVQQDKYNTYISQGMNPAKAARMASQDASNNFTEEKNGLVSQLYGANQDVVNAQGTKLDYAKAKDDVSNQNKGRVLATAGGVISGIANAI
ncbi:MAG: hypothetical protein KBT21_08540 [Treponema sp.]|nr:hypothetical protein [Candidatus Treponema merdequi]